MRKSKRMTPVDQSSRLPLQRVFRKLRNPRDLISASRVCREWHRCALSGVLWSSLDLSGQQDTAELLLRLPATSTYHQYLREVNLEFTAGVSDRHLIALQGLRIEALNLNGCQGLSQEAIVKLIRSLPTLRELQLYWILNVRDEVLLALAVYCSRLTRLSVSGCKKITDEGLRTLAGSCVSLQSLDLTRCLMVAEKGLTTLARSCADLRELRLYACSQVTDRCLSAFGELQQLRLIDLCGAHLISDDGLKGLVRCRHLASVNLTWCVRVTDAGVKSLAAHSPELALLSLHGIRGVTDAALDALSAGCGTSLVTLDVNGCVNIRDRSRDRLRHLFPSLENFVVHT